MSANEERETIIRLSPSEPGIAHVWTTEPKYWRRFAKAGFLPLEGSNTRGKFFKLNSRLILVRSKVPVVKKGFPGRSRRQV